METIEIGGLKELSEAVDTLIRLFGDHRVIAFQGDMGAGKTTLIRGICEQLGIADTVTSPTFALVNQYALPSGEPVYHFDFYRIDRIEEAYDFGYEEYFYSGHLCLIEWPERITELLPEETFTVRIEITVDESRRITAGVH